MRPPKLTPEQQQRATEALWSLWMQTRTPSAALTIEAVVGAVFSAAPETWRVDGGGE